MSDGPRYRVFPRKVDPPEPVPQVASMPLNDWEKKRIEEHIEGLSNLARWLIGVATYGVCILPFQFLAGVAIRHRNQGAAFDFADVVGFVAAVLVAVFVVRLLNRQFRGKKIAEKIAEEEQAKARSTRQSVESSNESRVSLAENEAQTLTYSLMRTYESASTLAGKLPQQLIMASDRLKHADREFGDNAFDPFWDAVENAAKHLATFDSEMKQASRLADDYYKGLNGRSHTFPAFPVNNANLPSPSSVMSEFRRIVRMGQTNFQFANIWTHRRTQKIMIAGFQTLGEAVNNLGSTVENAVFGLQQSVSSDVARLVQEEIKTRDTLDSRMLEQNSMLDNIQRHRKPE